MTWTNDTQYPVVIQGVNGSGTVKFVVYSVPNGRTTTFSKPIVKNYTKAHTETRVDKSIPRGSRKQIEYATDGQDVWVTRTVKDKAGAVSPQGDLLLALRDDHRDHPRQPVAAERRGARRVHSSGVSTVRVRPMFATSSAMIVTR